MKRQKNRDFVIPTSAERIQAILDNPGRCAMMADHPRPTNSWADFAEQPAPEEDTNRVIVALRASKHTVIPFPDLIHLFADHRSITARALRTLEKQGRIEWRGNGHVLLARTEPPVYNGVRELAPETSPIEEEAPVIHGPFGREPKQEPELQALTGVVLPPAPPVHPQDVQDVPAPILGPEKPPAATEDVSGPSGSDPRDPDQPTVATAAQQVLDNLSEDEPF